MRGLPPCKDVHVKINPFLCTKPCLNTFRCVSGLASSALCPLLPCFTLLLLLWGPQQDKGGGEGWLPAAVLPCLASCPSLPGVLLPVGAQPGLRSGSIKLSQGLSSSAELRFALVGGSGPLGCPGAVALDYQCQPGVCTAAAALLREMALLIIFLLLAWDW